MTPLAWICVLSAAGAVLFLVCGWLLASARRAGAIAVVERDLAASRAEVAAGASREGELRDALAQEQSRATSLQDERDELQRRGERAATDREEARALLQAARANIAAEAVERRALEERLREREREAARGAELERALAAAHEGERAATLEREDLRAKLVASERALHDARTARDRAQASAQANVSASQAEAQRDLAKAQAAARDAMTRASTIERERDEARARLRAAEAERTGALAETTALREELERTTGAARAAVDELATTRERLRMAEERARDLRPRALAADAWEAEVEGLSAELQRLRAQVVEASARGRQDQEQLARLGAAEERARAEESLAAKRAEQLQITSVRLAAAEEALIQARRAGTRAIEHAAEIDRLLLENAALRTGANERDALAKDCAALTSELRELRGRLQAASSASDEARTLRDEAARLRDRVRELESDAGAAQALDRAQVETKRARLDLELLQHRVDAFAAEREELVSLRARLVLLEHEASEAEALRVRTRALEAQLYAVGLRGNSPPDAPIASERDAAASSAGGLDGTLQRLIAEGASRTAVLADIHGLLVAGAGEETTQEGLAAVSGLVDDLAERTRTLLPLGAVRSVHMQDANDVVVACRIFEQEGEEFVIATIGGGAPSSREVDDTVAAVVRAMGGEPSA